jgi:hypothetical protein
VKPARAETRCPHGFLLSIVPCPEGCRGGDDAGRQRAGRVTGRDGRSRTYNYRDMTGEQCGTWAVLAEAPNVNGNTRWRARHSCGAEHVPEGIRLRSRPPLFLPNLPSSPAAHR